MASLTQLMGIVNVTPDSFYDGGRCVDVKSAVQWSERLVQEGATILDVGGESTRPGSNAISLQQELRRVIPVITALRQRFPQIKISVDTQKAPVALSAVQQGACIINDVSALRFDPSMADVAARCKVKVILMHMHQNPRTMQVAPRYSNVTEQVFKFLQDRILFARSRGIALKNIWVDPGIGFGKKLKHNLALLKNLDRFNALKCPIVLGCSRKSFIGMLDQDCPVSQRLAGSLAGALWGLNCGAAVLRVHDVAATRQAITVWQAVKKAK